mgnify:CR=1 FL=1
MDRWLNGVVLAAATMVAVPSLAQLRGEIAAGFAWQATDGSEATFTNHFNLDEGPFLERFHLDLSGVVAGVERCELELEGFGAEPWGRGRLQLDWDREWSLRLHYSRRESRFSSPSFDLGARLDDWRIHRLAGSLTYRGWERAVVRLDARDVRRQGTVSLPFLGLKTQYVARRELDERLQEVGLSVATRGLPVAIVVQQDFAHLSRRNRGSVANDGRPALGVDPDVLAVFTTPGDDTGSVPTSRLSAVYRGKRVEVVGRGLHRRDRLEASRNDEDSYDIGGGPGRAGFVDRLLGSAERATTLADLALTVEVIESLRVRVSGRWKDSTTDATLVGERILRLSGPTGSVDLPLDAADLGYVERSDRDAGVTLDWASGPFGVSLRYHDGWREAGWKRGTEYVEQRVKRNSSGLSVVAFMNVGTTVSAYLGWDDSDFSRYTFRTDPGTVERRWARAVVRPREKLELAVAASREEEDNPAVIGGLDARNDAWGASATYSGDAGLFATVGVEELKLSSRVDTFFFAPQPTRGVSLYDSRLLAVTARFGAPAGKYLRLSAGGTRAQDTGSSLPLSLDQWDARVELRDVTPLDVALSLARWRFSVAGSEGENYDVHRLGISVGRRF